MNNLGWVADGMERALAAGGIELEKYRRPGFVNGIGVRRSTVGGGGSSGIAYPGEADPWPDDLARRTKRRRAA